VKTATIRSVCECQARLCAELDEHHHVLKGWAKDLRRKESRVAPAHAIYPDRERFDVAWFCPFCVRNTLRSFDASGIAYRA
jgi:hypothetical protein